MRYCVSFLFMKPVQFNPDTLYTLISRVTLTPMNYFPTIFPVKGIKELMIILNRRKICFRKSVTITNVCNTKFIL